VVEATGRAVALGLTLRRRRNLKVDLRQYWSIAQLERAYITQYLGHVLLTGLFLYRQLRSLDV